MILAAVLWGIPQQPRALKPIVATQQAVPIDFDGNVVSVPFPELQSGPADYLGRRIRVSGQYARLIPPDCVSYNGPVIQWGIVADELQMNARGMESVRHLIPVDTMLTVEGVWRRYVGPVGCGKEPADDVIWYLAVERILQPNPLPLPGMPGSSAGGGAAMTPTAVSDSPLDGTPAATATTSATGAVGTAMPTVNPNATLTPMLLPTAALGTPTATMTPPAISPTPSATAGAGSLPPTTTATATATATLNGPVPSPTSASNNGQPPTAPTATPGEAETPGYPAPVTNTPDPSSYP